MAEKCIYCAMYHDQICPLVKVIEYHPDGTVKRVEFKTVTDYAAPLQIDPLKPPYTVT